MLAYPVKSTQAEMLVHVSATPPIGSSSKTQRSEFLSLHKRTWSLVNVHPKTVLMGGGEMYAKFPLAPMGALAPKSAQARASA